MSPSSNILLLILTITIKIASSSAAPALMVCNDDTAAAADVYRLFSVELTDECRDQSRLDNEADSLCFMFLMCGVYQKEKQERGARCGALRKRLTDQALGINAQIPTDTPPFDLMQKSSPKVGTDYTVDIDLRSPLLSFIPRTSKTVLWTTVVLVPPSHEDDGTITTPIMELPNMIFNTPISLVSASSTTNMMLGFGSALTQKNGGKLSRSGLTIDGCSVPSFTIRLEWQYASSSSVNKNCWRRNITITASREQAIYGKAEPRICLMPFSLDQLRLLLLSKPKNEVSRMIQTKEWGTGGVLFPLAYAEMLLQCATTGTWFGQDSFVAGICVSCASMYAKQQSDGFKVRSCNHSVAADMGKDCCLGCISTMMMMVSNKCVERCRPGAVYDSRYQRCTPCPSGLYSNGALSPCVTCTVLNNNDPNSWLSPSSGCKRCGNQASVSGGGGCVPCDAGKYVSVGGSTCHYCPKAGYFYYKNSKYSSSSQLSNNNTLDGCVACVPGTYSSSSSRPCIACSRDTFSSLPASTACHNCPLGHFSSVGATVCLPCPSLLANNATPKIMMASPFAEYFQPGCGLRCKPLVSYVRGSPYASNGCGSCAKDVILPIGSYPNKNDCTIALPCTAVSNAHFTTAGSCAWACNAGFYLTASGCVACNFGPFFLKERHRPTGEGCGYTCQPYIFVDLPQLRCDTPCVDLMEEAANGRLYSRVAHYNNKNLSRRSAITATAYVLGVCGSNDKLPRAEIRALRIGRWAGIGSSSVCGNSFLNGGEECDDGNKASGDGCSSVCKIEKLDYQYFWDCDLIGAPCVPNCGWSINSPTVNGVGLYGYVLPNHGDCTNLNYRYNVEPLSPLDRKTWMETNLINCNCFLRTLPYAECTAQNRGCRQCESGYYHDDLYGKCVACGSACAPGFTASACTPVDAPTGCVPCPPVTGIGRYVSGCKFTCADKYFCKSGDTNQGGAFCSSSSCGLCSAALQMIIANKNPGAVAGMYPRGCMDGTGYSWASCNPAGKPAVGAFWTANSPTSSDMDCPWSCSENFYLWRGLCLPCFIYRGGAAPCKAGERLEWCPSVSDRATCLPCMGTPSGSYQVIICSIIIMMMIKMIYFLDGCRYGLRIHHTIAYVGQIVSPPCRIGFLLMLASVNFVVECSVRWVNKLYHVLPHQMWHVCRVRCSHRTFLNLWPLASAVRVVFRVITPIRLTSTVASHALEFYRL